MRRTAGPPAVVVYDFQDGGSFDVFRIVRTDRRDDPALLNSFRSNYELDREPRNVERNWTVIYMGLSVYRSAEAATRTAQAWPKLGEYIAHVTLAQGSGFNAADTGQSLHLTIWADPIKLLESTVEINPVSR